MRYTTHEVDREAVFTFDAGQSVYELIAPDGTTYLMQTWATQNDPTRTEAALANLSSRLQLPAAWSYRSRNLDEPSQIVTTTTKAKVIQGDLGNSYSPESGS